MSEADRLVDDGIAALSQGRFTAAKDAFDRALALKPNDLDALYNRGVALQQMGQHDAALADYDAALLLAPDSADALHARGNVLVALDRMEDAAESFWRVVRLRPEDEGAHMLLHAALMQLKRFDQAIGVGERLVRFGRDKMGAYRRRGAALLSFGRFEEALSDFDTVLAAHSNDARTRVSRGSALLGLARYEEAAADFETGLAAAPDVHSGLHGLGIAYFHMGRVDDAMQCFDRFEAAAPESDEPLFVKGHRLLTLGRWREGWPLYERRWNAPTARMAAPRDNGEPAWDGKHAEGLVRLWAEQGAGDQILFAQLIKHALKRTPRICCTCEPRFAALFVRSFPQLEFVADDRAPAPVAAVAQAPLGSLGALLGIGPEDVDGAPYIVADPERVAAIRARYRERAGGKPVIGIAWSSNNAMSGMHKTAALDQWRALLTQPYFFVNLQYGAAAEQARKAEQDFGCTIFSDPEIDQMADMDSFAAQIVALDGLMSVSNTTVHVAGALGARCVVLLPPAGGLHWYWGLEGASSRWYASLRLVRRKRSDAWDEQIARGAAALKDLLAGPA